MSQKEIDFARPTINRRLLAFTAPIMLFLLLLGLRDVLARIGGPFWVNSAAYWIYPTQTILCGGLIAWFWQEYSLNWPQRTGFGVAIGLLVFFLWISPQAFFGFAPRLIGFDPTIFADRKLLYWTTIFFRFLRLVLVVPLVEEIFWRGFLLRFLVDERFNTVPFGKFSWTSFAIVSLAFGFSHPSADWPAAIVTGMFYNGVAYVTKNLSTCVLTHAVTNLLLGLWIMRTGQWGFW
jgi:CAAX prenyl protease-like protein